MSFRGANGRVAPPHPSASLRVDGLAAQHVVQLWKIALQARAAPVHQATLRRPLFAIPGVDAVQRRKAFPADDLAPRDLIGRRSTPAGCVMEK